MGINWHVKYWALREDRAAWKDHSLGRFSIPIANPDFKNNNRYLEFSATYLTNWRGLTGTMGKRASWKRQLTRMAGDRVWR